MLTGGLVAVLLFLMICGSLLYLAVKEKKTLITMTIISLLMFSGTESCFETQYGLVFFSFLPVFALILSKHLSSRTTTEPLPAIQ
mgnify:FL=1